MHDNAITSALIAAMNHGFDADLSVEDGLIRTGVDGLYRFFTDWRDAVADLTERVAEAVGARQ